MSVQLPLLLHEVLTPLPVQVPLPEKTFIVATLEVPRVAGVPSVALVPPETGVSVITPGTLAVKVWVLLPELFKFSGPPLPVAPTIAPEPLTLIPRPA